MELALTGTLLTRWRAEKTLKNKTL